MNKPILAGLLCLFITSLHAQVSPLYKGKITTRQGEPLAGVVIRVSANHSLFTSDSVGNFVLPLTVGTHRISFSHTGYQPYSTDITIPAAKDGLFTLEPVTTELDQVVVTAVTNATKIRRTPVSVAIVSQKEMNRNTSSNVIDAILKTVPGISAITTGPNISKPLIRGLGYTRVLTLYDGLRQEGQQWGEEHGVEIDQYGVARAEIVKGPASLMYGSDAVAGVVNLIPGNSKATDTKLHGDAVAEYQSNNGLLGASVAVKQQVKSFSWSARLSNKLAGNYRNAVDGRVYNSAFRERNLSLTMALNKTRSNNFIQFNLYDNLQEIPDGSRDSLTRAFTYQVHESDLDDIRNRSLVPQTRLFSYRISPLHQHIQHSRVYHKSRWQLGTGQLSTLIGFQQNRRREYNHPTVPHQPGLDVQLSTWNYELTYGLQLANDFELTYGINGMYQLNTNRDATDFPIPNYRLFDIGTYLIAKKEISQWVFTGGIRIDSRYISWDDFYTREEAGTGFSRQVQLPDTAQATLNFPSYKRHFNGVSGSLGLVFNASGNITIKANLARGYRCPSIPEIGSDGLDPGARIYYIGNRDFRPEFNWQGDIGFFFNNAEADAGLEVFHNNISNYIFLQKLFDANGHPLELVPGNFTYQYRQGSARLYGAEASWAIHPTRLRWLHLQQSLAFIHGSNTDQASLKLLGDDARYLPLIPPFRTATRLRINLLHEKKKAQEAYMQAELETYATQNRYYAVDNTETATPGYALFNIGAGVDFGNKKGESICTLSITANNLFDVAYQSHQNRLKYFEYYQHSPNGRYGIYNMGRNIAMKLVFKW